MAERDVEREFEDGIPEMQDEATRRKTETLPYEGL